MKLQTFKKREAKLLTRVPPEMRETFSLLAIDLARTGEDSLSDVDYLEKLTVLVNSLASQISDFGSACYCRGIFQKPLA